MKTMGITHTTVGIAPVGKKAKPWKGLFLVDSGASTSMAPGNVLKKLGIRPFRRDRYELADGTMAEFEVGGAMITVKSLSQ
jgi:predicted aspartyl protease